MGRWLCATLVGVGFAAVASGTCANRPRLSLAGSILQMIGALGAMVLAHG